MNHPSPDLLVHFAAGMSSDAEEHVRSCPECAEAVAAIREVLESPAPDGDCDALFQRLARERDRAVEALASLHGLGDERVRNHLTGNEAFRTAGGLMELIDWVPSLRRSEPERYRAVVRAIAEIADGVDAEDPALVADLRVAAQRELAAAERSLGRYDDALRILETIEPQAEALPIPDLQLSRIWLERARVLAELGECDKARRWAVIAADSFERFGDARRRNRSRFLVGTCLISSFEFAAAAAVFEELLEDVVLDGDLAGVAETREALGHLYARLDRLGEAREHLVSALRTFRERGMTVEVIRSEWGLAQIRAIEGNYLAAATDLKRVSKRFEALGMLEESNLVKIDLYGALVMFGEWKEGERVIGQSVKYLSERLSGPEQKRALARLEEITAHRHIDRRELREISDFLNFSRRNPRLAFPGTGG